MEVVDVCAAMDDVDRRVYLKIAKRGKLDSMLVLRLEWKTKSVKNLQKVDKPKTSSNIIKRTIFLLPAHELRHLMRQYGQGFHQEPQTKFTSRIYLSAKPLFKTCWFFRTNSLQSLSAAAMSCQVDRSQRRLRRFATETLVPYRHRGMGGRRLVSTFGPCLFIFKIVKTVSTYPFAMYCFEKEKKNIGNSI